MKILRYSILLFLAAAMFGADAANDLLLTQRNSTNDDNVSRNVTAAASALLAFDGSLVPTTVAIGATAGTVAAGNDSRITGAAQKASNLSDLASATTARTNLGVGTADSPSFAAATASTGSFTATATGTGLSLHGGGTLTGASGAVTIAASGTNKNVTLTPSGDGLTNLTSGFLQLAPVTDGHQFIMLNGSGSLTGKLIIQAGGGSPGFGGGLNLYSHSHATKPGWVVAGISTSSGGKFSVNQGGLGGANDVFTVDAAGNVSQLLSGGIVSLAGTTSASSSTVGALLIGNGTAATNVAIGGGNINAGGTLTSGGVLTASSPTAASASAGSIRSEGGISAAGNLIFNNGASVASVTASRRASQGLNSDGTAVPGTIADLASLATGTDDFGFEQRMILADYTPAANVPIVTKFAGNLGWKFWLVTTGVLRLEIGNNTNFSTYRYDSTVAVPATDGHPASFAFFADRSGNLSFYVNGKLLGAAVDMSGSVAQTSTSTGSLLVGSDGTAFATGTFYAPRFFNRALTAAEVLALYETGTAAAVDLPQTKASSTALNASAFIDATSGLTGFSSTASSWTGTSPDGGWRYIKSAPVFATKTGDKYRVTFTWAGGSPGLFKLDVCDNAGYAATVRTSPAAGTNTYTIEIASIATSASGVLMFGFSENGLTPVVTDISVVSLGALCALDESQSGNGNTWYDVSGNEANITLSATGVTWDQPSKTHAPTAAYGVGTAYSLTDTAAAIDFGTTDPVCVLDEPGTYLIMGQINLAATGATVTAETATIKVRRTNNTAADLSVIPVLDLPAMTTLTYTLGIYTIPPFTYTTTATNDSITIFANVSAALAAGTIDATAIGTSLVAIRLY